MRSSAALLAVVVALVVALSIGATHAQAQNPTRADSLRRARAARDSAQAAARADSLRRAGAGRDTTNSVAVPARPDSIRPDTSRGVAKGVPTDSAKAPKDTIKAPLAHAESPPLADVGPPYHWDRAAMFASGALTVTDLLERVPGMTTLRSGWINGPMSAAYLGDVGRIRIFYDGIELAALDPRNGGSLDLSTIELWTLEDLSIERGADEVRVYMRSWRVQRTATSTRTDIVTGDEDTNLYRGFFGRRMRHGEALQLAFQQYNTQNNRVGGGGDQLTLLGRVGVARGRWSFDAFATRANRSRSGRLRYTGYAPLLGTQSRVTNAYVRAGYGDPEQGAWAQVTAASLAFGETTPHRAASGATPADSADTTRSSAQYVAAAGFTRWGLRLSATERLSAFQGELHNAASARASFERRFLALSLFGERAASDSTWRGEALARFRPLSFIAVAGAASVVKSDAATNRPQSTSLRGEADLRLLGVWLGLGVLARDSALLPAPAVFDTGFVAVFEPRQTGTFATVRGRIYKGLRADAWGVRWDKLAYYRPAEQARSELYIQTDWRSRFPSGNFGFLLSAIHEYRGETFFPLADTSATSGLSSYVVPPSRSLSFLLELRIVSATLSVQLRNALGEQYQQVPGYEMPRATSIYGVRWEFWN
ncbi:MAG TPA: TonB-dependent receptor plug domain-containing protein [Gemmatimonadaceae bacterium]|nr:TonB-dependent receptor plug domain-containing protein [Gemmatimonadaceae bacterium]